MIYLKLKHGIVALGRSVFIDENTYEYVDNDGEACAAPLGDIKIKMDSSDRDMFTLVSFPNNQEGMEAAYHTIDTIWQVIRDSHAKETICVDLAEIIGETGTLA